MAASLKLPDFLANSMNSSFEIYASTIIGKNITLYVHIDAAMMLTSYFKLNLIMDIRSGQPNKVG